MALPIVRQGDAAKHLPELADPRDILPDRPIGNDEPCITSDELLSWVSVAISASA